MSQRQPTVITIDPSLPCGMIKSTGPCGNPAHKGRIRQVAKSAGKWEITPICQDCAMAAMSVFWGGTQKSGANSDTKPEPGQALPAGLQPSGRQRESARRYAAQFMSENTAEFVDFAYWATEKQATGHVLMTISSNPRVKAGRVFDQIEQRVIGEVHYKS